jgi:hypothetical protein
MRPDRHLPLEERGWGETMRFCRPLVVSCLRQVLRSQLAADVTFAVLTVIVTHASNRGKLPEQD